MSAPPGSPLAFGLAAAQPLLARKRALITGAGSGIGRATALSFGAHGASVVVSDVDGRSAAATCGLLQDAGVTAASIEADVSSAAEVQRMVDGAANLLGGLDCAFNNAGIGGTPAAITDTPVAEFDRVIAVDLRGTWLCLAHELACMAQHGGAIVNCSSISGVTGFPAELAPLVAAKHGVEGLTKAAAVGYAQHGIRVNAVRPGTIRTSALRTVEQTHPDFVEEARRRHPIGRLGTPEEVAELVAWLCSDRASFVTGAAIAVDGGFTCL